MHVPTTVFVLLASACCFVTAAPIVQSRQQGDFGCPAVDDNNNPLNTVRPPAADDSNAGGLVCVYAVSGTCRFFADSTFSSGGSGCPGSLVAGGDRGGGGGDAQAAPPLATTTTPAVVAPPPTSAPAPPPAPPASSSTPAAAPPAPSTSAAPTTSRPPVTPPASSAAAPSATDSGTPLSGAAGNSAGSSRQANSMALVSLLALAAGGLLAL